VKRFFYWPSLKKSVEQFVSLPKSGTKNAILVVVDRLSKYAYFIALSHHFTAQTIAQLFIDNIFKLHGLPAAIVIDRDRIFISKLW
jgi:hypothetical protein